MNIDQIIASVISTLILALIGYIAREWKAHNTKILAFKQKEEDRAIQLVGQQNYDKGKQIVIDAVYKVEQLAKENLEEKWDGMTKHDKCIEFATAELNKWGISLTDEDVFNIIKSTVGFINANKK